MQKLLELYKKWSGAEPKQVEKLAGAGSNREYYRLVGEDGTSVVGCVGTSRDENHAFVYLAKHFEKRQLPFGFRQRIRICDQCLLQICQLIVSFTRCRDRFFVFRSHRRMERGNQVFDLLCCCFI